MVRHGAELTTLPGELQEPGVLPPDQEIDELKEEIRRNQPLPALLSGVVERVRKMTRADGAAIALRDEAGVTCRATTGDAPEIGSRLEPDSSLTRECFETGTVVVCEDTEKDFRVRVSIAKSLHLRSAVAVPIQGPDFVLGVLEVLSARRFAFGQTDVVLLQRVASLIAPIVFPAPPQKKRAWVWLGAIGAGLCLLLIFLIVQYYRRPATAPPATAIAPSETPTATETEQAQGAIGMQNPGGPERAPGTAISPLSRVEKERPRRAGPARQSSSPPRAPTPLSVPPPRTTAKLEPLPLPVLKEAAAAPNLAVKATIPALARSLPELTPERTLKGHSGWVTAVAFSADGRRLVSGSWDQSVKFWDLPTGQATSTLASRIKEVQAIAFSRDGRWLAAENSSNKVTLWDAASGREVRTFRSDKPLGVLGSSWVYSIAFSPDGRWLASGVDDKTVRVWEVATGRVVRDLTGQRRKVIYIAFSPDGRRLASGDDEKTIKIWDAATGKEIKTLRGHKKSIYAVAFSPNGRWLASASADKTVKIWDASTGREVRTLTGHGDGVTSLAFNPDGRWLASGSWDKTVKIWDVESGRELQTLEGHSNHVYTVAFASNGHWLASGSEDGTIRLWRVGRR